MIADGVLVHMAGEWWWPQRQCAGADQPLFTSPRLAKTAIATYCQRCPVRLECLGRAMDRPEQVGVAGGLTQTDRARLWLLIEQTKSIGEVSD